MHTVVQLKCTSPACPSQWEGLTDKGEEVYIRYRWGKLRVDLDRDTIFLGKIGGELDGYVEPEELKKQLQGWVEFYCEVPEWEEDRTYPIEGVFE